MPRRLSQVGAFDDLAELRIGKDFVPYEVNVPFWSDGAEKKRWMHLPTGKSIRFAAKGEWAFPSGTLFVKHFELNDGAGQRKRLETRILVCDGDGIVHGGSYRWRDDWSDADLVTEPVLEKAKPGGGQDWYYPGEADCVTCHTKVSGGVLGVNARQLNRDSGNQNQLLNWEKAGQFSGGMGGVEVTETARLCKADDSARSLEDRARSFLDVNCAYCHRPGGVAGNFDARFDTPLARQNLVGGPVLIDLGVDRARVISPRDVWRSIALIRVETGDQTRMPPLAHLRVDQKSAAVLREWIASLPGQEVLEPPRISPQGGEFKKAVNVVLKHSDSKAVIRYTVDGSAPNNTSAIYKGPIEVTEPVTLRARAYEEGKVRSVVVQETFVVGE